MSVLIRGMEMPVMCSYCKFREPFIDSDYCHLAEMDMKYEESNNCRHPNCPLVEVKEPHGRLGDLDKLKAKFRHSEKDDEVDKAWNSAVRRIITQAETIIEPEGSEE